MKINQDKVPTNLDDAVQMLFEGLEPEDITEIKKTDASDHHHFAGRNLRNMWSLWERETPLVKWFCKNMGLGHADDLSGIIMKALWCKVCETPFDIEREGEYYRSYWREQGVDPITMEPVGN